MPRPKPPIEDTKIRITVSLPLKVIEMCERYRFLRQDENLSDFSALVNKALISYALQRHPDILDETVKRVRMGIHSIVTKETPRAPQGSLIEDMRSVDGALPPVAGSAREQAPPSRSKRRASRKKTPLKVSPKR